MKKNNEFLLNQTQKNTLKLITCGSVDDGKSTLVGRLLHESKNLFEDQLKSLKRDSEKYGTQGNELDFALLVDGLNAEREQGITIDVAYRFFETEHRRYIVADTPGHEQYTRNMATGSSNAELAVLLVDAQKGILSQTRRHYRIVSLMGINNLVVAVNKMDLVRYQENVFQEIKSSFEALVCDKELKQIQVIPISAVQGVNITKNEQSISWYSGPSLLEYLDKVQVSKSLNDLKDSYSEKSPFRMPVQQIIRSDGSYRGISGRIISGSVCIGDAVRIQPSGVQSRVQRVDFWKNSITNASTGASITLTLEDNVDVSRGDVISDFDNPPQIADQFNAELIWLSKKPLIPKRYYLMRLQQQEVNTQVTRIRFKEEIETGKHLAADQLEMNDIAQINISTNQPVVFEPYASNRIMGGFILIDKMNFDTVGVGIIKFALRRSSNLKWQELQVNKIQRARQKMQIPRCLWFTGLSGSGKSTIASLLEKKLHTQGHHTYLLDGDNIRHGLNRDLGFTDEDRVENLRRISQVAKLMVDAGLIVLVSFISPFRIERQMARELFELNEFFEIFIDTPLEECERRDTKGLYAKARSGQLKNFTGIDSNYEPPEMPEIKLNTLESDPELCVDNILEKIIFSN